MWGYGCSMTMRLRQEGFVLLKKTGGVCPGASQNCHWQDEKKWPSEKGVWSDVSRKEHRSQFLGHLNFLYAAGEEGHEEWFGRISIQSW